MVLLGLLGAAGSAYSTTITVENIGSLPITFLSVNFDVAPFPAVCSDLDYQLFSTSDSRDSVDALLREMGYVTWAYITAFNPGSIRLTDEENHARQRELNRIVRQLGHPAFPGEGICDNGLWLAEQSILVLGIERAAAVSLGRVFDQRAIVCGDLSGAAVLVPCE